MPIPTETDLAAMAETIRPAVVQATIRMYLLDCLDHSAEQIATETDYSVEIVRRALSLDVTGMIARSQRWETVMVGGTAHQAQVDTFGPSRECLRDMVNARGAMLRDRGVV